MTRAIADIMATQLVSFTPDTNIHTVIHVLLEKRLSGAPIVDDAGTLVGVVSKKDCLKIVFSAGYHLDRGSSVADYMSAPAETLDADMDVIAAAEHFINSHFRRFPVMRDGKLVGQVSRHDILKAINEDAHTA